MVSAEGTPEACSSKYGFYTKVVEYSIGEHICTEFQPSSAPNFKRVLARYETEDAACYNAARSHPDLRALITSEPMAKYIRGLKEGTLPTAEITKTTNTCRSIVQMDDEQRAFEEKMSKAMPSWPKAESH